jgi:hypothetical protein
MYCGTRVGGVRLRLVIVNQDGSDHHDTCNNGSTKYCGTYDSRDDGTPRDRRSRAASDDAYAICRSNDACAVHRPNDAGAQLS